MKTSISLSKYLFSLSSIILIVVFYWIFSTIQNDAWFYPSWSEICGGIGKIITSGEKMSYFGYSFLRILFTILLSLCKGTASTSQNKDYYDYQKRRI